MPLRSQVNLKVKGSLFESSLRTILALIRTVPRIKANASSVHRVHFIRTDETLKITSQQCQLVLFYGRIKLIKHLRHLIPFY